MRASPPRPPRRRPTYGLVDVCDGQAEGGEAAHVCGVLVQHAESVAVGGGHLPHIELHLLPQPLLLQAGVGHPVADLQEPKVVAVLVEADAVVVRQLQHKTGVLQAAGVRAGRRAGSTRVGRG